MLDVRRLGADFIDYVENVRNFSPATVRSYRYILKCFIMFLGDRPLQDLTLKEIDDYIVGFVKEHNLKPSSANTERCVLRAFFLYCDKYRNIRLRFDYSMIRGARAPAARIEFVKVDQARQIVDALQTSQDKLMVITLFSTGMRIGELVRFCVDDFQDTEIRVRGKGNKDRVIPIDDSLSGLLRDWIYENRIVIGPVFKHQVPKMTLANQAFTVSGFRHRLERQLKPLGLYVKPHAFRHGIATRLLQEGMDLRSLQTFLGHSRIDTTMIYTHITDNHLRESYLKHFPTSELDVTVLMAKTT